MKIVVLQSNYIPWKGYFDLIHDADLFIFYDEVKYTKNDWRNRNRIYTVNGLHWLTIPINKDAVKQKISEVMLPPDWQEQHYQTLTTGYKRASYYNQLEPLLSEFYLKNKWTYLSELNHAMIEKISRLLNIETRFEDSKNFNLEGERVERLINLLKQAKATEYISGPSAKSYLDGHEHLFEENNIKLTYKNYNGYPEYTQLKEPFEHAVSIIDILANVQLDKIPNYIWKWRNQ